MADSLDAVLEKALSSSAPGSRQEALVVVLHACLLAEGYECIGVGEEGYDSSTTSSQSPLVLPEQKIAADPKLPEGWNSSPSDVFCLQYQKRKTREHSDSTTAPAKVLVKVIPIGEQLLVNAVSSGQPNEVHCTTLDVSKFFKSRDDSSAEGFTSASVFRNLLQLVTTLNKEIVAKLSSSLQKTTSSSSSSALSVGASAGREKEREKKQDGGRRREGEGEGGSREISDPLRIGPPRHPHGRDPLRNIDPLGDPFDYGRADLDPFAGRMGGMGGGGGMILDPMRGRGGGGGGGFGSGPFPPPPPSHPSGARFDPVYPHPGWRGGGGGGRGGPGREGGGYGIDPDHLPPPGYDDMFS